MSRAHLPGLVAVLVLLFGGAAPALGHGAGWEIETSANPVLYRFGYTDGSPLAFAEVIVTGPDGKTWQKARTDRTGRFAFALPGQEISDSDKSWQIEVADGMGHTVKVAYQPTEPANDTVAKPAGLAGTADLIDMPRWAEILFGFSLLANLFGGFFLWRRHQSRAAKPDALSQEN